MSKIETKDKTKVSEPKAPATRNGDQHRRSQTSAQVDADLRAQLSPELRKLYDLYYPGS